MLLCVAYTYVQTVDHYHMRTIATVRSVKSYCIVLYGVVSLAYATESRTDKFIFGVCMYVIVFVCVNVLVGISSIGMRF